MTAARKTKSKGSLATEKPLTKSRKAEKPARSAMQPEDFGYPIRLVRGARRDGGFRIKTGCRDFTLAEARTHWQKRANYATPTNALCGPACPECAKQRIEIRARARNMLKLLPLLATRAKRYDWL